MEGSLIYCLHKAAHMNGKFSESSSVRYENSNMRSGLTKIEDCRVKGSSLIAVVKYMEMKWGKAYINSLKIPFDIKEIKRDKFYPYEWMIFMRDEISKRSVGREEQTFKKVGYDVIKSAFEGHFVINYIVKKRPLEKILADMEKNREYLNVYEGEGRVEDGRIIVRADQVCETKSESFCWITEGALRALIEASGKNATVKHTKCMFHGDDHCIFEITEEK